MKNGTFKAHASIAVGDEAAWLQLSEDGKSGRLVYVSLESTSTPTDWMAIEHKQCDRCGVASPHLDGHCINNAIKYISKEKENE